ncbi:hypothetical protein [Clostridium guangxiense]|uniref:hypothetical protein n=1 Tax=Clostridium guangxiense TaxID=1662055 RepID=UPI001E61BA14|nr:hypothetical protein [Clostridium guangxiense]MCD2346508.1 hypothetical protein [Clostridium guangxiense]
MANEVIIKMLENEKTRIYYLDEDEKKIYEMGLRLFSALMNKDFFDIPRIDMSNPHKKEGLFYEIPYYDSNMLFERENKRLFLRVQKVKSNSIESPFKIYFKMEEWDDFSFIACFEELEEPLQYSLVSCRNGDYFTEIHNYDELTLTKLMNIYQDVKL